MVNTSLSREFPKTHQDGHAPSPPQRIIDPQSPIASLAAGPQQFTAIADTDHSSAKIMESLTKEIPQLAQAGVKHLMLEYYIPPVESPYRTNGDWQIEDILSRVNSRPPTITEEEILANSPLFTSVHEKKETNETGTAHAHLLIAAMKHGVTIHFANNGSGFDEGMKVEAFKIKLANYQKENEDLENHSRNLAKDPEQYLYSLKLSKEDTIALLYRIDLHVTTCNKYKELIIQHLIAQRKENMSQDAENDRAASFIALAQGEKSVVVFGRDHFRKESGLNEAIDTQLTSQALAKGQPIPEKTAVAEIWDSRAERTKWLDQFKEDETISQPPSLRIFADTGAVEIPEDFAQHYKLGTVKAQQLVQNMSSPASAP